MEFKASQEVDVLIKRGGIWVNGLHLIPRGNIMVEFTDSEKGRMTLPEVLSKLPKIQTRKEVPNL